MANIIKNSDKEKIDILLIEDCLVTASMLIYNLGKNKYNVKLANNKTEAEKILHNSQNIKIIITDWHIDKDYKGGQVIDLAQKLNKGEFFIVATSDNTISLSNLPPPHTNMQVIHKGPSYHKKILEVIKNIDDARK